jgi:hypothetical protein
MQAHAVSAFAVRCSTTDAASGKHIAGTRRSDLPAREHLDS